REARLAAVLFVEPQRQLRVDPTRLAGHGERFGHHEQTRRLDLEVGAVFDVRRLALLAPLDAERTADTEVELLDLSDTAVVGVPRLEPLFRGPRAEHDVRGRVDQSLDAKRGVVGTGSHRFFS